MHTLQHFSVKIVSQNAPDYISGHIHFKNVPDGYAPEPARKLVAFGHSGVLLPQTINPRKNPARSLYLQCSISQPTQPRFLGFGGFGGKRAFLRVWRKQKKQSILSTWAILLFFIDPSYLPFPPLLRL